ncbi:MAG TPA: hypothetical protein VKS79_00435 [Gemmataceae bacterium]|nr:hypothetical protein [Gemmataceae bacterium]
MRVPQATQVVLSISMWFVDYWWIFAPVFSAGLAALVGIGFLCRHRSLGTFLLWLFITTGAAIVLNAIVVFTIQMGLATALEGLSR